jgi:hypothetical protein
MRREVLAGAAAGAVGTTVLNMITYGDMAVRGRPASSIPAQVAGTLAADVGVRLRGKGDHADAVQEHRQNGLGALLGYAVGIGIGTLYGALRARTTVPSRWVAGVGIGLAAMLAGDLPGIVLKKTNPLRWSLASWASDVIPHLAYGLATATTFEAIKPQPSQQLRMSALQAMQRAVRTIANV